MKKQNNNFDMHNHGIKENADIIVFLIAFLFADYLHSAFDLIWFGDKEYALWQFLLYPFISAVLSTVGAIALKRKVLDRFLPNLKSNINVNTFKLLSVFSIFIVIFFLIAGLYRVESTDSFVLTEISGDKVIVDDVGWHYRLQGLTELDRYNLRNNFMTYPTDKFPSAKLITADDKVINIGGTLYYKINDLNKWGIINQEADKQLASLLTSSIDKNIRVLNFDEINVKRLEISEGIVKELKEVEDRLGIEVIDFKLKEVKESEEVILAKSSAEAIKITSEAKIQEAENLRLAIQIQQKALHELSPQELQYLSQLELYKVLSEKTNAMVVVPSSGVNVNIPTTMQDNSFEQSKLKVNVVNEGD